MVAYQLNVKLNLKSINIVMLNLSYYPLNVSNDVIR